MDEFRVERMKLPVTIRLRGEATVSGHVFVPVGRGDEPAVGRIHELLNSFEPFLPVEESGVGTVLHRRDRMVWCRYDGPIGPVVEVMLPRRRVTLGLEDGSALSGDLVADGPPESRRVLDCLNRSTPFLLLESRDGDYLVRKEAIAWVPSPEQGEPRVEEERAAFEIEEPVAVAV